MNGINLERFFNPRSIAILGASRDATRISAKPLHYLKLHGFTGNIYPINPKYQDLAGYHCYSSIGEVPDEVDLALIAVNYRLVPSMLDQCVAKGVRFATIFSSGFAEVGEEGHRMQRELATLSQRSGLRLCGPNCQGGVSLHHHTAAAFSAALDVRPFLPGSVGFVTQSGALGFSIFNLAQEQGIGFSYVVSSGNEVDLDALDFMRFMVEDPQTKTVFAYLEGIRDGAKFSELAERALELEKPLAVLKVGKSEVGARAASSHTAALTGSDAVFDAFFHQKGIIRVDDIEEFIDLAKLLQVLRRAPQGKGLGIVSTSGGGGVLCADVAEGTGLGVVELKESTSDKIRATIPHFGSALNPVDMTAKVINTAEGFWNVLQAMIDDPGVDALVVVITMIVGEPGMRMAKDLARAVITTDKPIVIAWTSGANLMSEQFAVLARAGVPCYQSPRRAVKTLAKVLHYGTLLQERRRRSARTAEIAATEPAPLPPEAERLMESDQALLSESQAKRLLQAFGLNISREETVRDLESAWAAAAKIGYPVAIKVDSPDILHKTEARAIRLNLPDREALSEAYAEVLRNASAHNSRARINGVSVQEMIPPGVEVIIGARNDPQFGPVLMFGLGGIFVEILKDVSLRTAPIDYDEALAMIRQIRGYGLLAGVRGRVMADVPALAEALVRVSHMVVALGPRLLELDINPLVVLPEGQGVKVADALIKKSGQTPKA